MIVCMYTQEVLYPYIDDSDIVVVPGTTMIYTSIPLSIWGMEPCHMAGFLGDFTRTAWEWPRYFGPENKWPFTLPLSRKSLQSWLWMDITLLAKQVDSIGYTRWIDSITNANESPWCPLRRTNTGTTIILLYSIFSVRCTVVLWMPIRPFI